MADIPCPLREAAVHAPELPALETRDRDMTFRELDAWVEGTSARLVSAGVGRGDRVAMWMENDWRMVVLILAALRGGLVACPLSTRLPSIDAELGQVDAGLLISDRDGDPPDAFLGRASSSADVYHPPTRPATVIFTSGTSGQPKAALHTYANHYYSAEGSNQNIRLAPGDRWLLSLPLYHVGGIAVIFRCLLGRAAIALRPDRPIDQAVSGVTHVSLVATQLLRLLHSEPPLDRLKAVLLGGSEIPRGLIDSALERHWPIHTSYGLTEMASQVATTGPGATRAELLTSGRILPHRELMIASGGEILVRGQTRFAGFVEGPELFEPFDAHGWYATRDVGRLTEAGLLEVLGRADNVFVSGGENVSPEEIETALTSIEGVDRAVVVAVLDDEFGRRPVAFVDVGVAALDPGRIRAELEKILPRFKIPDRVFPWPKRDAESGLKVDRAFFRMEAERLTG